MNEMMRLAAIVRDRALKNAPATPDRNASGVKMIIVAAEEPASGLVNSFAALNTRERGSPSMHAANATDDMFHHYDRVVDDETNSRGHAAKCHDVETHFQDVEKNDRGGEHSRNSQNRNQRDFPIAKKNEQNERGKNHADHDCVARAAFRRDNQIALIVPVGNLHPIRNLLSDFAQFRFDAARDFDRVSGRLLVNLEKDGVMTVGRYADPLRLGRMFNRGHVVEQDHAVRSRAQHGVLDLVELFETRVRNDEIKFVVLLEAADRD